MLLFLLRTFYGQFFLWDSILTVVFLFCHSIVIVIFFSGIRLVLFFYNFVVQFVFGHFFLENRVIFMTVIFSKKKINRF